MIGVNPQRLRGKDVGVFSTYANSEAMNVHVWDSTKVDGSEGFGNLNCLTANRISYHFDFRGKEIFCFTKY